MVFFEANKDFFSFFCKFGKAIAYWFVLVRIMSQ
jgi:hypothetical protein